jgi:hypothetical protein
LVFIDETWTKTNMAPLTGWAPRGTRLVTKVPHGHWKTMTFLAALRHDRVDAPWLLDGPIDGESFKTYVEKVLLSIIHENDPPKRGRARLREVRSKLAEFGKRRSRGDGSSSARPRERELPRSSQLRSADS